jgi:hypothetical protein
LEETGIFGENYIPAASHWQTLSYKVVSYAARHVYFKFGFFNRTKKEQLDEFKRKSNYYEKRKTQRLEAARSKAMSKFMSRSDEVILHQK